MRFISHTGLARIKAEESDIVCYIIMRIIIIIIIIITAAVHAVRYRRTRNTLLYNIILLIIILLLLFHSAMVNFASSTEMEFDGGDRSDDASERLLQIYMRASVCAARRENRYHRVPYSHIIISYICGSSPAVYIQYNFVPTPWPGGDTRYIRIYIPIIRVCIAVVMR